MTNLIKQARLTPKELLGALDAAPYTMRYEAVVETQLAKAMCVTRDWLTELDRKHSGQQGAIWAEIVEEFRLFEEASV